MSAYAWQVLGLAPTDDVRAIKRAYAACLKRCRPEDDAEGFARLRGAYEMLLAQATARAPLSAPLPTPAASQVVIHNAVDPSTIVNRPTGLTSRTPLQIAADVLQRAQDAAGHDATRDFGQWLANQPELMLLERKPSVSRAVLAGILRGGSVLPPAFARLQEFFHWDDQAEQRRLAQAGLPVEVARGKVQAAELRLALARGSAPGKPYERDCQKILQAGAGRGAWWLAIARSRERAVPTQLQLLIKQYGYHAVAEVFGNETLAFWQRALDEQFNRLQWLMALAKPVLIGMLIVLVGLVSMLLGRLGYVSAVAGKPNAAVDIGNALLFIGLAVMVTGGVLGSLALIIRWIRSGPVGRVFRRLIDVRDALALDQRLWRGALATALLLLIAWYWPVTFNQWPYLIMVALLLLLYLRDRRSLTGLGIFWWGVSGAFADHPPATLLAAAMMPSCLWLGHAAHRLLQRWRIGSLARGSVVLVTCVLMFLLLFGAKIAMAPR